MIVSLVVFGRKVGQFPLAEYVAWGSVVGSAPPYNSAFNSQLCSALVRQLRPVIDLASLQSGLSSETFSPSS